MGRIAGKVFRVTGPVVEIEGVESLRMLDMVSVGEQMLVGEVVRLKEDKAFVQVYEDTTSIKAGDPVYTEGYPLYVELGPGLISSIYDGIQRPLSVIEEKQGMYIGRGVHVPALDREKKWHFTPVRKEGDTVSQGQALGWVQETSVVRHKIMVPPDYNGKIIMIAKEGDYKIEDKITVIENNDTRKEIQMYQKWPVRTRRPYQEKLIIDSPLITGQRVIDTLFPVAKGGCVAVPGGFGTGKTVIQHQLAKWSDAQIVVYIGCGERGNEMTDILTNFPKLIDPKTQKPLMERTIFIANTSNMPVAAREASIYTGITLAEYYRDMGYNVALMADSTSRWAEALRELSGRLEEMPMEEGFPSYLPSRLAEFYERAGRVKTYIGDEGSVTAIASVSPPGGDFSEPVTSTTKRFVRCFWALDRDLANSRHYPSISWIDSYSQYIEDIKNWWSSNVDKEWYSLRYEIMDLLQQEQKLLQIIKLVGPDVLPQSQRLILEVCSIFKNGFLQQNSFDPVDTYSSARKQFIMLKTILVFYKKCGSLIEHGMHIDEIKGSEPYMEVLRMKTRYPEDKIKDMEQLPKKIEEMLDQLAAQGNFA